MKPKPLEAALLETARAAIEQVLACSHDDDIVVPFHCLTELAGLPAEAREAVQRAEEKSYRERPVQSALHFCLVSASALLDVSQSLMNRPVDPSPQEQEHAWKTLATYTKIAGRSAYRAALILADPAVPVPLPLVTAPASAASRTTGS